MIWPENIKLQDINQLSQGNAVEHLGIIITELKDDYIACLLYTSDAADE